MSFQTLGSFFAVRIVQSRPGALILFLFISLSYFCSAQDTDANPLNNRSAVAKSQKEPNSDESKGQSGSGDQQSMPPAQLPNAPSSTKTEPSLSDLGFPTTQTQSNPQEQARLDRRSRMLKIHQKMGLITAVPLVATVFAGAGAGGRSTSSSTRDLHAALGGTTAALYFTTASFAILAPKIEGTPTRGPIKVHKALAWVHGPGMILTPILGEMAFNQKSNGERIHGIASAHGAVAVITVGAYGAAMLAVSVKF